jgi:hypothetical protein
MKISGSLLLFIFVLLSFSDLTAQVSNDHASNAVRLIVDSAFYRSDTKNCTLEDSCLNRKLTAKCLVYHNDQWFTFATTNATEYYLSVKNQNCRDVNGVQVLLIDGCICKPSTYEAIECASLATQDDIYITLKNLKKNHSYIINLDGYLNDFCEFEIGVTTTLPAFALIPIEKKTDLEATRRNGKVCFSWHLNEEMESLKIVDFEIDRRFEIDKKFISIGKLPVERSVNGKFKTDYQYCDTINRKGQYSYKVIGIGNEGQKYLLGEHGVFSTPIVPKNNFLLELPCKNNTAVSISVFNWENQQLLGKIPVNYYEGNSTINVDSFFQIGIIRLKLVAIDEDGKKIKEFLVDKKY